MAATALNFLCNDATTTACVLVALHNLYDHAHEDEWSNDAYTDIVWNVGHYDNVSFYQIRDAFQDYLTATGLRRLFETAGWTVSMDVCESDTTPLRLRLVRDGPEDDFPDRRNFIDTINPLELHAMMNINRNQS